jgi:uncharacterized protein YggE
MVTPDRASFTFGTVSQGGTAASALAQSSQAARAIIAALRRAGVAKDELQTSEASLSPRFDNSGTSIVGYTASNSVTATVRRIAAAGAVVDAAVGAGANEVSGPNLVASDQKAAARDALRAAVADARTRAEALASASGRPLGKITAISEQNVAAPVPQYAARLASADAVPIEPGKQSLEVDVSVTFALA